MGVGGLESFLLSRQAAVAKIAPASTLRDLVNRMRSPRHDKAPAALPFAVLDGENIAIWLVTLASPAKADMPCPSLYGGDYSRASESIRALVTAFEEHGVKLVVTFSGQRLAVDNELKKPAFNQKREAALEVVEEFLKSGQLPPDALQPRRARRIQAASAQQGTDDAAAAASRSSTAQEDVHTSRLHTVSNSFHAVHRMLGSEMTQLVRQTFADCGAAVEIATGDDDAMMARRAAHPMCVGVLSFDTDFLLFDGIAAIDSRSFRDGGILQVIQRRMTGVAAHVSVQKEESSDDCSSCGGACAIRLRSWTNRGLASLAQLPVHLLPDLAILCGADFTRYYLPHIYGLPAVKDAGVPNLQRDVAGAIEWMRSDGGLCTCKAPASASIGYHMPTHIASSAKVCPSALCSKPMHIEHHPAFAQIFSRDPKPAWMSEFVEMVDGTRYYYGHAHPQAMQVLAGVASRRMEGESTVAVSPPPSVPLVVSPLLHRSIAEYARDPWSASVLAASSLGYLDRNAVQILSNGWVRSLIGLEANNPDPLAVTTPLILRPFRAAIFGLLTTVAPPAHQLHRETRPHRPYGPWALPIAGKRASAYDKRVSDTNDHVYTPMHPRVMAHGVTLPVDGYAAAGSKAVPLASDLLLIHLRSQPVQSRLDYAKRCFSIALEVWEPQWFSARQSSDKTIDKSTFSPASFQKSPWLAESGQADEPGWPLSRASGGTQAAKAAAPGGLVVMAVRHLLAVTSHSQAAMGNGSQLKDLPTLSEIASLVAGAALCLGHAKGEDLSAVCGPNAFPSMARPLMRSVSVTTWYRQTLFGMLRICSYLGLTGGLTGQPMAAAMQPGELEGLLRVLSGGDQTRLPGSLTANQLHQSLIGAGSSLADGGPSAAECSGIEHIRWPQLFEGRLFHFLLQPLGDTGTGAGAISMSAPADGATPTGDVFLSWLHPIAAHVLTEKYPAGLKRYLGLMHSIFSPFNARSVCDGFADIQTRAAEEEPSSADDDIPAVSGASKNGATVTGAVPHAASAADASSFGSSQLVREALAEGRNAMHAPERLLLHVGGEDRLPIAEVHDEALVAMSCCGITAVISSTGSGKTTQLPQYLLHQDSWARAVLAQRYRGPNSEFRGVTPLIWGSQPIRLYVTQPTRLATTESAKRVSYELAVRYGIDAGESKFTSRDLKHLNEITGSSERVYYTPRDVDGVVAVPGERVGYRIGGESNFDRHPSVRSSVVTTTAGWMFAKLSGGDPPDEGVEDDDAASSPAATGTHTGGDGDDVGNDSEAAADTANTANHSNLDDPMRDVWPDPTNGLARLGLTHLIIDEVHERSTENEALCLIVRDLMVQDINARLTRMAHVIVAHIVDNEYSRFERRDGDFEETDELLAERVMRIWSNRPRLMIMSATFDAREICQYFEQEIAGPIYTFSRWLHAGADLDPPSSLPSTDASSYLRECTCYASSRPLTACSAHTSAHLHLPSLADLRTSATRAVFQVALGKSPKDLKTLRFKPAPRSYAGAAALSQQRVLPLDEMSFQSILHGAAESHTVRLDANLHHVHELYLDSIFAEATSTNRSEASPAVETPAEAHPDDHAQPCGAVRTPSVLAPAEEVDDETMATVRRSIRGAALGMDSRAMTELREYLNKWMAEAAAHGRSGSQYRRPVSGKWIKPVIDLSIRIALQRSRPSVGSDAVILFVPGVADIDTAKAILINQSGQGDRYIRTPHFHIYNAKHVIQRGAAALPLGWESFGERIIGRRLPDSDGVDADGFEEDDVEEDEDWQDDDDEDDDGIDFQEVPYAESTQAEGDSLTRAQRRVLSESKKIIFVGLHAADKASLQNLNQLSLIRRDSPFFRAATVIAVATPVAESAITIPGLHTVIDMGLHKEVDIVEEHDASELLTGWISQAAARQRKGRAGRTPAQPGVPHAVFRLYTKAVYTDCLRPYSKSGMQREVATAAVLKMKLFAQLTEKTRLAPQRHPGVSCRAVTTGTDGTHGDGDRYGAPLAAAAPSAISAQSVFDRAIAPPPPHLVQTASLELYRLGILSSPDDNVSRLTPLGVLTSRLPVDPASAVLILAGKALGCLPDSILMAAYTAVALSGRPLLLRIASKSGSPDSEWTTPQIIDTHYRSMLGMALLGREWSSLDDTSSNFAWSDHILAARAYMLWRSERTRFGYTRDGDKSVAKLLSRGFNIASEFVATMDAFIRRICIALMGRRLRGLLSEDDLADVRLLLPTDAAIVISNRNSAASGENNACWPPKGLFSHSSDQLRMVLFSAFHTHLAVGTCRENRDILPLVAADAGSSKSRQKLVLDLRLAPSSWSAATDRMPHDAAFKQLFAPAPDARRHGVTSSVCGTGIRGCDLKTKLLAGGDGGACDVVGVLSIKDDHTDIVSLAKDEFFEIRDPRGIEDGTRLGMNVTRTRYGIPWPQPRVSLTQELAEILRLADTSASSQSRREAPAPLACAPPFLAAALLLEGRAPKAIMVTAQTASGVEDTQRPSALRDRFAAMRAYTEAKKAGIAALPATEQPRARIAGAGAVADVPERPSLSITSDANTSVSSSTSAGIDASASLVPASMLASLEVALAGRRNIAVPSLLPDVTPGTLVPLPLEWTYMVTWKASLAVAVPPPAHLIPSSGVPLLGAAIAESIDIDEVGDADGGVDNDADDADSVASADGGAAGTSVAVTLTTTIPPSRPGVVELGRQLQAQFNVEATRPFPQFKLLERKAMPAPVYKLLSPLTTTTASSSGSTIPVSISSRAAGAGPAAVPAPGLGSRSQDQGKTTSFFGVASRVLSQTGRSGRPELRLDAFSLFCSDPNALVVSMRIFRLVGAPAAALVGRGLGHQFGRSSGDAPELTSWASQGIDVDVVGDENNKKVVAVTFDAGTPWENKFSDLSISLKRWEEAGQLHLEYLQVMTGLTAGTTDFISRVCEKVHGRAAGVARLAARRGNAANIFAASAAASGVRSSVGGFSSSRFGLSASSHEYGRQWNSSSASGGYRSSSDRDTGFWSHGARTESGTGGGTRAPASFFGQRQFSGAFVGSAHGQRNANAPGSASSFGASAKHQRQGEPASKRDSDTKDFSAWRR